MPEWVAWVLWAIMITFVFSEIAFAFVHEKIHQIIARRLSRKYKEALCQEGLKFVDGGIGNRSYTFYIMPIHENIETFKNWDNADEEKKLRLKLFKKKKELALFLLAPCFPIIGLFLISSLLLLGTNLSDTLKFVYLVFNSLCCIVIYLNYLPRHIHKWNRITDGMQLMKINKSLYYKSAGAILFFLAIVLVFEFYYLYL